MLWFHLRCISHSQDWSRNLGLPPVPSPAKGTNRVSNSQMNITFRPAIRASAMCCGNTLYNTLFARSPLLLTLFAAIESCNQKNSIIQVISLYSSAKKAKKHSCLRLTLSNTASVNLVRSTTPIRMSRPSKVGRSDGSPCQHSTIIASTRGGQSFGISGLSPESSAT